MRKVIGKITGRGYTGEASTENDRQRLADMLAHRSAPRIAGATAFNRIATRDPLDGVPQMYKHLFFDAAREAGVNVTGKVYKPELADYPTDPTAWVSSKDECLGVLKAKGNRCESEFLEYEPPEWQDQCAEKQAALDEPYRVAPDIVEKRMADMLEENPEIAPTPKEQMDLRDKLTKRMSGDDE